MKLSKLTIKEVKSFLVIEDGDTDNQDDNLLTMFLSAAKTYILNYTGLSDAEADSREDLSYVALMVTASMYENRELMDANKDLNKLVEYILGMHSFNLLA